MAKSYKPPMTQKIRTASVTRTNANTTALQTVYTCSADDAILKSLILTSTDTVGQNIQIWLTVNGTDMLIGTVPVAINAGNTGTIFSVDGINASILSPVLPRDHSGRCVLPMEAGNILKISTLANVSATRTIFVTAIIEEY